MKHILSFKALSTLLSLAIVLTLAAVLVYREYRLERPEQIQITTADLSISGAGQDITFIDADQSDEAGIFEQRERVALLKERLAGIDDPNARFPCGAREARDDSVQLFDLETFTIEAWARWAVPNASRT